MNTHTKLGRTKRKDRFALRKKIKRIAPNIKKANIFKYTQDK